MRSLHRGATHSYLTLCFRTHGRNCLSVRALSRIAPSLDLRIFLNIALLNTSNCYLSGLTFKMKSIYCPCLTAGKELGRTESGLGLLIPESMCVLLPNPENRAPFPSTSLSAFLIFLLINPDSGNHFTPRCPRQTAEHQVTQKGPHEKHKT